MSPSPVSQQSVTGLTRVYTLPSNKSVNGLVDVIHPLSRRLKISVTFSTSVIGEDEGTIMSLSLIHI